MLHVVFSLVTLWFAFSLNTVTQNLQKIVSSFVVFLYFALRFGAEDFFPESSGKQVLYQQMLKPTLAEKYACAEPAMPGCPGNTPFDWLDRTTRVLSLQNDSWENHVGREDRSLSEHVLSTLSYSITCVEERLLSVKHSFADHRRGVSPRSAGRLVGLWLASAKISHATRLLDLFCTERSLAQLLSHSIHCGTEAAVTLQMMRGLLL